MSKIVILNFSGKERGNCSSVAEFISEKHNRTNVLNVRISDYFKPCGNCRYECLQGGKTCPEMGSAGSDIMESICDSDLTYFIIPNYCGSPCSNYYAFNERSVGWFNGDKARMIRYLEAKKKFIFISNTDSDAFRQVIAQQSSASEKDDTLYMPTRKYNKRSIDGDILESDDAKADLTRFIALSNR